MILWFKHNIKKYCYNTNINDLNLKVMKSINAVFCLLLFVWMSACTNRSSPSEVALNSCEAWCSGDVEGYFDYINVTKEERKDLEGFSRVKAAPLMEKYESKGGVAKVEVIEEEMSDDGMSCEIDVMITFKDGSTEKEDVDLDKVNGRWYVHNPFGNEK